MARADPEWASEAIGYGLSSGEGLVERVKDDADADPLALPSQKRLLCIETEFARPITAMRREGNTLSPLLRSAWDSQTLEVLTRGKSKLRASNAHVSILAHITPPELSKLLSGSVEVTNGFSNRFLWAIVKRSKSLPDGGDPRIIEPFVGPLAEAIAKAKASSGIGRDASAKALWHEVYEGLTEARPGAFGMATSRGHAQVLRLSLIYALLDGADFIRVEHLKAALAVWAYCVTSARMIFGECQAVTDKGKGEAGEEPLDFRLLMEIKGSPGITRNALIQSLPSGKRGLLGEALDSLESHRLAYRRLEATAGRPSECWYPGPKPNGTDDAEDRDEGNAEANASASPASRAEAKGGGLKFTVSDAGTEGMKGKPPEWACQPGAECTGTKVGTEDKPPIPIADPLPSIPCQDSDARADGMEVDHPLSSVPTFVPEVIASEAKAGDSAPLPLSPILSSQPHGESLAIEADDFLAAIADATATPNGEDDDMSIELYHQALAIAGLNPATPPPYSPSQVKAIRWAKNYALAQAASKKRRRERANEAELSVAEFTTELMAMA
jgi:hypothetical protein